MKEKYKDYKARVVSLLVEKRTWNENGVWKHNGKYTPQKHILPLRNQTNNPQNRAFAIKDYLHFDVTPYFPKGLIGLHPYAHHLTSSQSLCLQFFAKLIDSDLCATEKMVIFIKEAFGIDIHVGAECRFEYTEREKDSYRFDADSEGNLIKGYEGTSFDFHIKDGSVEIFFEIKFTEEGFKKEKVYKKNRAAKIEVEDKRHITKATEYLRISPQFLVEELKITPKDFLKQYQIYRNIIRATDSNKYVVFISDENNPATEDDKEVVEALGLPNNIIFKTWQQLIPVYPYELPFQLKAIQSYK